MDEQPFCTDPELGEVLRQYLLHNSEDIPGVRIKDALFHLGNCNACKKEFPDVASPWGHAWWRAIISGRVPVAPGEILNAEYHWTSCDRCKQEYPSGLSALASTRATLREAAKSEILRLYHEYTSTRHRLLAEMTHSTWEEENEAIARTLACLASNAGLVKWELAFFHEMEGLGSFQVFPDADNPYGMEAWRGSNPLIRSVPKEVQRFIFEATLCADLVRAPWSEEELLAKFNNELKYSLDYRVLLKVVEGAAVQYLGEYLQENPELAATTPLRSPEETSGVNANTLLRQLKDLLTEFERRQEDQFDSLKAVDMGIFQVVDRIDRKPSECEPALQSSLGELYALLSPATREFLQQGEWDYERAQLPSGYANAVSNFVQAFENEFKARIAEGVARELVKRFGPRYPTEKAGAASKAEAPLVVGGAPYPSLTLGNYSWYMQNDPNVGEIVTGLGANLHELRQAFFRLTSVRNRAVHPQRTAAPDKPCEIRRPISPKDAHEVRKMVLGPQSILKLLFPSIGSESA